MTEDQSSIAPNKKEEEDIGADGKAEKGEDKAGEAEELCYFIYHPHELWLKGKNRPIYEKQLMENLRKQLKTAGVERLKIRRFSCEMLLSAPVSFVETIYAVSKKVFGIAIFSRCYRIERDIEVLKNAIGEHIKKIVQTQPIVSFKVDTSRVDKRYPVNSMEMSKDVGAYIFTTFHFPVNLKHPGTRFNIEVQSDAFYFYTERLEGAGCLPVGTSGKVVVLLSGGFDSPVASWHIMRRGCTPIYVHFHSSPYGEWRSSISKVRKIVSALATWGGPTNFFSIPIGELQRQIALKAPPKLRITLYRRFMVRIAAVICKQNNAIALATGDNLGQVASQTIDSMTTIQSVVNPLLILRPLLCDSKDEIIAKAEKIGTKELSMLPAGDCCSHMLPKKVATHPTIEDATAGEAKLDIQVLVDAAIAAMQRIDINDPWNDESPEGEAASCPLSFEE